MRVVFLYGPPAAGKYTIGKLAAEELGIPLFHNHLCVDLVSSLFDFGSEGFVELRERIWFEAFEQAAEQGISFLFTFNPENTIKSTMIDLMKEIVVGQGGDIVFISIECSEDEIRNRLADDDRKKFGKLTDVGLYDRLMADGAFKLEGLPEPDLTVLTDFQTPEQSAAQIVEYLSS